MKRTSHVEVMIRSSIEIRSVYGFCMGGGYGAGRSSGHAGLLKYCKENEQVLIPESQ